MRDAVVMVVPTYGRPDLAVRLMRSFDPSNTPFVQEVVFVEDSESDHELRQALLTVDDAVKWRSVSLGTNRGFAAAANEGVDIASAITSSGLIFLLNSDVRLQPHVLPRLLDYLSTANVSFVVPRMVQPSGLLDGDGDLIGPDGASRRRHRGERPDAVAPSPAFLTHPTGGAMLFPVSTWTTVGSFDERLRMYYEDVDWGLRAFAQGLQGSCCPDAVVEHEGHGTTGRKSAVVQSYRNYIRVAATRLPSAFLRKHWKAVARGFLVGAIFSSRETSARETLGTLLSVVRDWHELAERRKEVSWTVERASALDALIGEG